VTYLSCNQKEKQAERLSTPTCVHACNQGYEALVLDWKGERGWGYGDVSQNKQVRAGEGCGHSLELPCLCI
jgi:hypothetical protein